MPNKGLYRTGLIFAMLTALGWALFVAGLISGSPTSNAGPVADYLADANSSASLLYLWGGVLGSIGVIPVYVALVPGYWRDTGSALLVPITLAIVGVIFLTLGFTMDVGSAVYIYAPAIAEAAEEEAMTMLTAAQLAQDSIETTWAIGSFLAYGGPFVWLVILFFRVRRIPKWLNWLGIVGGLGGFVWITNFIPVPPIGPIPLLLNIVLGMVWLIGVSLILVRTSEDESGLWPLV